MIEEQEKRAICKVFIDDFSLFPSFVFRAEERGEAYLTRLANEDKNKCMTLTQSEDGAIVYEKLSPMGTKLLAKHVDPWLEKNWQRICELTGQPYLPLKRLPEVTKPLKERKRRRQGEAA